MSFYAFEELNTVLFLLLFYARQAFFSIQLNFLFFFRIDCYQDLSLQLLSRSTSDFYMLLANYLLYFEILYTNICSLLFHSTFLQIFFSFQVLFLSKDFLSENPSFPYANN